MRFGIEWAQSKMTEEPNAQVAAHRNIRYCHRGVRHDCRLLGEKL
jgi:hypothetical protein